MHTICVLFPRILKPVSEGRRCTSNEHVDIVPWVCFANVDNGDFGIVSVVNKLFVQLSKMPVG